MWSLFALVLVLFAGFVIWRKSVADNATGGSDNQTPKDWTDEMKDNNPSDVDRLS